MHVQYSWKEISTFNTLKGLQHEMFEVFFFIKQTLLVLLEVPQNHFLPAIFHGAIQILIVGVPDTGESQLAFLRDTWELSIAGIWDKGEKRIPGVRDTGESRIPGVWDTKKSRTPGVQDTGQLFFDCSLFCSNFKLLLQSKKQQSITKQCESIIYLKGQQHEIFELWFFS